MIRLVIFDIAGTIIHDRGEVSRAFVEAIHRYGFRISDDDVLEWKGAGKRAVIRHLLEKSGRPGDADTIEAIHANFVTELHRLYDSGALRAIPAAEDTFRTLRERGLILAVTTGFGRSTMRLILERLNWTHYFAARVSAEDVAHGRPAPDMIFEVMRQTGISDPRSIANLGDTPLDLQSGDAAGVAFNIGVLTGMHTRERLSREPHTHLLDSLTELPALLSALNSAQK